MTERKTRDVAGILHFLTPQQMAEEIVRLDAVIAGQAPNIVMGRLPTTVTMVCGSTAPRPPCTVCGKPYADHGTYPTCATHPYTAAAIPVNEGKAGDEGGKGVDQYGWCKVCGHGNDSRGEPHLSICTAGVNGGMR